jgi:F-type H+-transporting ATPase subunit b
MDSLISTFNIDVKLLIAQAVNFAIVFGVLYYFALRPLMKIMGERTEKIEKGLADAKKIEDRLAKTEADYEEEIARARKEANGIIVIAQEQAEVKRQETIARAKEDIGVIINEEKSRIQQEKARTLKELKAEVADLVVASVEKLLAKKIDDRTDREIIKKMTRK